VRKLVRFGLVGVVSTVVYALLYLFFRQGLGAFAAITRSDCRPSASDWR
jgi:putative flippase GtrA